MRREIILDNTVLANLSAIDNKETNLFSIIRNLEFTYLIPIEVKNEFSNHPNPLIFAARERIANQIHTHSNTFQLCTSYDSAVLEMVKGSKGIDKGEAEIIAQAQKRNVYIVLTDDEKCIKRIKQDFSGFNLRFYNSLFLIALLEIGRYLIDYNETIKKLHKVHPFSSKKLRTAFENAYSFLSFNIDSSLKREISRKSSLNSILKS